MFGVLIVEDEEWIRRGLIRSIDWERLGLELVGEADNGARALELLRSRPVDIVLTDMKMPRMRRAENAPEHREHGAGL